MTTPEPPENEPPSNEPSPLTSSGSGLRGPEGCAEWTVVVLGVIWALLAIIFVIALIVRMS